MDQVHDILQRLRDEPAAATGQQPAPSVTPAAAPVAPAARKRLPLILGTIAVLLLGGAMVIGPAVQTALEQVEGADTGAVAGLDVAGLDVAALLPKALAEASASPSLPDVAHPTPAATIVTPGTSGGAVDWRAVVTELTHRRTAAFAGPDHAALQGLYIDGASNYLADLGLVAALEATKWRIPDARIVVEDVQEVWFRTENGRDRVGLRVRDSMPGYDIVDAKGKVLQQVPARGTKTWSVTLERDAAGAWRYAEVLPLAQ